MDFLSLLSAPVSYLAQEQYDFTQKDKEGYTVLHYATLAMKFTWLEELLSLDENKFISRLSVNTDKSNILTHILPKLGQSKNSTQDSNLGTSMPFGEHGYCVPHLMVWMIYYYSEQSHIDKNSKNSEIISMIHNLIEKDRSILKIKDDNGLSVLEYILMLNLEEYFFPRIPVSTIDSHTFCLKLKDETLIELVKNKKSSKIKEEVCNRIMIDRKKHKIVSIIKDTQQDSDIEINNQENDLSFKI